MWHKIATVNILILSRENREKSNFMISVNLGKFWRKWICKIQKSKLNILIFDNLTFDLGTVHKSRDTREEGGQPDFLKIFTVCHVGLGGWATDS